jgi:hypothetical protein
MDTYAEKMADFEAAVTKLLGALKGHGGVSRAGIGLCTSTTSGCGSSFKYWNVTQVFQYIDSQGIQEVDIWDTPLPASWLPFLKSADAE